MRIFTLTALFKNSPYSSIHFTLLEDTVVVFLIEEYNIKYKPHSTWLDSDAFESRALSIPPPGGSDHSFHQEIQCQRYLYDEATYWITYSSQFFFERRVIQIIIFIISIVSFFWQ